MRLLEKFDIDFVNKILDYFYVDDFTEGEAISAKLWLV